MALNAYLQVLGRAVLDGAFRSQLVSGYSQALQGFNLTPAEIESLRNIPGQHLESLANQFQQHMRGAMGGGDPAGMVDVFSKADFHKFGDLLIKGESQPYGADMFIKGESGSPDAAVDMFIKGEGQASAVDMFIKGEGQASAVDMFIKGEAGADWLKLGEDLYLKLNGFSDAMVGGLLPAVNQGFQQPGGNAEVHDISRPGGRRRRSNALLGILISGLLFASLIGLLLFLPGGTVGGLLQPIMGDGSTMQACSDLNGPAVNGDGNDAAVPDNNVPTSQGFEGNMVNGDSPGLVGILIGMLNRARMSLGSEPICFPPSPDFDGNEALSGPSGGTCGIECETDADCATGLTCQVFQGDITVCYDTVICTGGGASGGDGSQATCNQNAVCDAGEDANCSDCQTSTNPCGNGVCDPGEHVFNCSVDCGQPPAPQDPNNPALDCTKSCGNGTCDAVCGENPNNCPAECP